MLFYSFPGKDDSLIADKVFQDGEFFGGQGDGCVITKGRPGIAVHSQVGDPVAVIGPASFPAQHHPDARQQFLKSKGLYQIIIGAGVQAGNPVTDTVPGGEQ